MNYTIKVQRRLIIYCWMNQCLPLDHETMMHVKDLLILEEITLIMVSHRDFSHKMFNRVIQLKGTKEINK